MKALTNFKALWLSLGVIVLFLIGHYAFGRDAAKIVMDSLVIGSAATIALSWARGAAGAIRTGVRDGAGNIQVSVWLVWTLLLLYFVWVVSFTGAGRPEWLRQLPIGGLFSSMFFLAGAYAVLTPVNTRATIEKPSMVRWIIAVAVGSLLAGALITAAFHKVIEYS